jgi:hypothetical protein
VRAYGLSPGPGRNCMPCRLLPVPVMARESSQWAWPICGGTGCGRFGCSAISACETIMNVDHLPGDLTVPFFGPRMVRNDRRRCAAELARPRWVGPRVKEIC